MISAVTSPEEAVTLHCPSCGEEKFIFVPMSGKNGERFVRINCHKCQEHLFFQNPEQPNNIKSHEDISEQWKTEQINNCLLYKSDAADEQPGVDLGVCRSTNKKATQQ